MKSSNKEIILIYVISIIIAGWAYIGARNSKIVENSVTIYVLFVLAGILFATVIAAFNARYKKYRDRYDKDNAERR